MPTIIDIQSEQKVVNIWDVENKGEGRKRMKDKKRKSQSTYE